MRIPFLSPRTGRCPDASRKRAPQSAAVNSWSDLLQEARNGSALSGSFTHGEVHWRAVAATGLRLRQFRPSVSARLLLAFGMIHDCRREDEGWDPDHGRRASEMALSSRALRRILEPEEIRILAEACLWHEKGRIEADDLRIGLCWDSDRYNLIRLDIRPVQELLSAGLSGSEHEAMIRETIRMLGAVPDWADLVRQVEAR